jgi:hypothetical protein
MGIYFESTMPEQDANIILQGIKNGEITEKFHRVRKSDCDYPFCECDNDCFCYTDENLVWISDTDTRTYLIHPDYKESVTINGIKGKLTIEGCRYITNRILINFQ